MNRLTLTESEKAEWVELYEDHDLSAAAFCREFGLPYASFLKWRRQWPGEAGLSSSGAHPTIDVASPASVEFVELVSEETRPQRPDRCVLAELELGAGHVLRVFRVEQ